MQLVECFPLRQLRAQAKIPVESVWSSTELDNCLGRIADEHWMFVTLLYAAYCVEAITGVEVLRLWGSISFPLGTKHEGGGARGNSKTHNPRNSEGGYWREELQNIRVDEEQYFSILRVQQHRGRSTGSTMTKA